MYNNSLAHTKWNELQVSHSICAKIQKKRNLWKTKADLGKILRDLCQWKGVTIIEAHACPDHIHIYVEIPPKLSVSSFVGFLKGKIALFERHANLKYKNGNSVFWCKGYYVSTVGRNKQAIERYIKEHDE